MSQSLRVVMGVFLATGCAAVSPDVGAPPPPPSMPTPGSTPGSFVETAGEGGSDAAWAVATDNSGNAYVSGSFNNRLALGAHTLMSAGDSDGFLAKLSTDGTVLWAERMGGGLVDRPTGVAVDLSGNVTVVGSFSGTANFGGGDLVALGVSDMFVAQYNGDTGAHQWSERFGGTTAGDSANAVAVDSSGNLYVTGTFSGTVNFGGADLTVPFTTDLDLFILKLTSSGAHVWSKNFPNDANDIGNSITVDRSGNVAVLGSLFNSINFTGNPLGGTGTLTSSGSLTDLVVASFTSDGTYRWSKQLGSAMGNESPHAIGVDSAGNIIVTGVGTLAIDMGGGPLPGAGSLDTLVGKYAGADGAFLWAQRFGGAGEDIAFALTVDAQDNIVLAGSFTGAKAAFGTTVELTATAGAGLTGFMAKLSGINGNPTWARGQTGSGQASYRGVAMSADSPVAVGYFMGTPDFDGVSETSAGSADIVILRSAP